jgi:hypothetical protein
VPLWLSVPKIWPNMWILWQKIACGGHFENCIDFLNQPKFVAGQCASVYVNLAPVAAILKIVSTFWNSQNLYLVNTLLLILIWPLCDSLFRKYGQICEFCGEKQHVAAILKIVLALLDCQNLQLVNMLLLTLIWLLCDILFPRHGQICEFCDEKRPVAAILKI